MFKLLKIGSPNSSYTLLNTHLSNKYYCFFPSILNLDIYVVRQKFLCKLSQKNTILIFICYYYPRKQIMFRQMRIYFPQLTV